GSRRSAQAAAFADGGAGAQPWRRRHQAGDGAAVRARDRRCIAGQFLIGTLIMLRIQHRFVEQVQAARSGPDLHDLIQGAIELEHSTIPPYLTAMLSFQPQTNREIWAIIYSVVIDEMLHMTIA